MEGTKSCYVRLNLVNGEGAEGEALIDFDRRFVDLELPSHRVIFPFENIQAIEYREKSSEGVWEDE